MQRYAFSSASSCRFRTISDDTPNKLTFVILHPMQGNMTDAKDRKGNMWAQKTITFENRFTAEGYTSGGQRTFIPLIINGLSAEICATSIMII